MRHKPNYDHAGYLRYLIPTKELRKSLRMAKEVLKNYQFDSIAFRGQSGSLIGPPLALAMNKAMLMVRKPNAQDVHSCYRVEGNRASKKYVIVDDQVSTGKTRNKIVDEIKEFAPDAKCIGILCINYIREGSAGFKKLLLDGVWQDDYC